jgi:hypothetical protein
MTLTDTQRAILEAAARHPNHLAYPPARLPSAARQAVAKALMKHRLVIGFHQASYDAIAKWTVDGDEMLLKLTDEGLRAIGIDPNEGDGMPGEPDCSGIEGSVPHTAPTVAPAAKPATQEAPVAEAAQATPRTSLREAAAAVLAAWDDEANREGDMIGALDAPMEALRTLLAGKPARIAREPGAPRKPREGTKQEQVLAMLRRPEGATVAQIAEATGWAQHTVRGFFAGLKKKGHAVEVRDRIRQVGPNKTGAKGSFTIYALTG